MSSKNKKKKNGSSPRTCDYYVEWEGKKQKMVINCKDCDLNYSIANSACFSGIMKILSETYMIDYLNMSHYLDTMYFGDSVDLIKKMKDFSTKIQNFSVRKPQAQFKHYHPKFKKKIPCITCQIHPKRVFPKLDKAFMTDMDSFYNRMKKTMGDVHSFQSKAEFCNTCRYTTMENLNEVFSKFDDLVRFILEGAYKIIYRSE